MRFNRWTLLLVVVFSLPFSACTSSSPSLNIEGAWARPSQAGANSAVYFVLTNLDQDDWLLSAASPVANQAQIHATIIDQEGAASMQQQEQVEVPAGAVITFRPGGLHIMLLNLTTDLVVGDTIQVTLTFRNFGETTIDVPVGNH